MKPLINIHDLVLQPFPAAMAPKGQSTEKFEACMAMIAPQIGAQKLGYNLTAVPPGKRAFPLHNHHVNEEMFFILEGSGELLLGTESFPLRAGDVVACPPGGPERAHQIINTGGVELRYLAVSTKMQPEVVQYPNTGKFGVLADYGVDAQGRAKTLRYIGREDLGLDYWEGE